MWVEDRAPKMDGRLDGSKDGCAGRIEVIEGRTGQRQRSEVQRVRSAAESLAPGAKVADVARRHGVTPNRSTTGARSWPRGRWRCRPRRWRSRLLRRWSSRRPQRQPICETAGTRNRGAGSRISCPGPPENRHASQNRGPGKRFLLSAARTMIHFVARGWRSRAAYSSRIWGRTCPSGEIVSRQTIRFPQAAHASRVAWKKAVGGRIREQCRTTCANFSSDCTSVRRIVSKLSTCRRQSAHTHRLTTIYCDEFRWNMAYTGCIRRTLRRVQKVGRVAIPRIWE
ncbi:hypothetical protein DEA8626_01846 [Defluviimonas aquaemixtae]|uniref:Uncharacterized protein n=1 Tax=Albidovulum aquaemixtae TaxID=1542388 RepID=A0A2R8B6Z6_9RHOB|nr:hypothetical protein DEA8626_01846 [Defluviimonas aquaemixtae]